MSLQYSVCYYVMLGGVFAVALGMDDQGDARLGLETFLSCSGRSPRSSTCLPRRF